MRRARFLIVILFLLLPVLGSAADEALPDAEMLEFLGRFETAKGKPVDPLVFLETSGVEPKKDKPAEKAADRKRRKVRNKNEQKDPDNEN